MKYNNIHFIINPAAGNEVPIISYINKVFCDTDIDWDVSITKKNKPIDGIVRSLIGNTDIIAVYGGDGSVTEVAAALCGSDTPMAIIPGGTANVMAKELGIPLATLEAIQLLAGGDTRIEQVDMGTMNNKAFLLRVNLGIMADMILKVDSAQKETFGQIAYGISALKTMLDIQPVLYALKIDGERIEASGVALTVTNAGNAGMGEFVLQQGISVTDGLLDVLLLPNADLTSMLKVAGSTVMNSDTDVIKHWQCKEVTINMENEQHFICDDHEETALQIVIKVLPASVKILVPYKA